MVYSPPMEESLRQSVNAIAMKRWPEIVADIDELVEQASSGAWPRAATGSQIAADDAVLSHYRLSHALQMLLNAGTDALSGVRHLVWGRPGQSLTDPVIHQAAHYVLARAAIENFATAVWILQPDAQAERVERVLRWHAKNIVDQHKATDPIEDPRAGRSRNEKLDELCEVLRKATGREPPKGFRGSGYAATAVLEYVDATKPDPNAVSAHLIWQLCSGFAHGRPWASLTFLEKQQTATEDPGVVSLRLTSDLSRAFIAPDVAVVLLKRFQRLQEVRGRRPY